MSLFTYIALPREVDISSVKQQYTDAEVSPYLAPLLGKTSEEIPGFYLGDEFTVQFPYGLCRAGDHWQEVEGLGLYPPGEGQFVGCFGEDNRVIYEFFGEFRWQDAHEFWERVWGGFTWQEQQEMTAEEKESLTFESLKKQIDHRNMVADHTREQLHQLLTQGLKPGERAEIYSEFTDHSSPFRIGPPEEKFEITLAEVLTSVALDTADRRKITIALP